MSPNTEYRPWPRAPRFLVGSDGSIIGARGAPLTPYLRNGYLSVGVWLDGRSRAIGVHIIVCETFHGPRPPGHEAAHDSGVKSDCSAGNLGWKTPRENAADKIRHGTTIDGERNGAHILTLAQVREIRASHETARVFAERFGVSLTTVYDIRNGRTWQRAR